jgi:hypothetical protein
MMKNRKILSTEEAHNFTVDAVNSARTFFKKKQNEDVMVMTISKRTSDEMEV